MDREGEGVDRQRAAGSVVGEDEGDQHRTSEHPRRDDEAATITAAKNPRKTAK